MSAVGEGPLASGALSTVTGFPRCDGSSVTEFLTLTVTSPHGDGGRGELGDSRYGVLGNFGAGMLSLADVALGAGGSIFGQYLVSRASTRQLEVRESAAHRAASPPGWSDAGAGRPGRASGRPHRTSSSGTSLPGNPISSGRAT